MKAHERTSTYSTSAASTRTSRVGEILLLTLLLSTVSTIWIAITNEYIAQGFWYIAVLPFRRLFTIYLFVLVLVNLLFYLSGRAIPERVAEIVKKMVILFGCTYLASLALGYPGLVFSFVESARKAALVQHAASFLIGCTGLLLIISFSARRRALEGFFRAALLPALVLSFLMILSPYLLRDHSTGKNVIFITIDTLRADHLSCYGYGRNTSPNLDDFSRESVQFLNAAVQWPKTSPSFASIMTSLYCSQTGVTGTRQKLPRRKTTVAEVLLNAGYLTAGVVGNGNLANLYNFNQGFSTYIEAWKDDDIPPERLCDARHITDRSLPILEKVAKSGNFFMWIHYIDPHAPYSPPSPFDSMYVNDEYYGDRRITLNDGYNDDIGGCPKRSRLGDHDNLDFYIAQYDAEIRYFDSELKRLFDFLETNDLMKTTMIVISSDHGESLGEHNYYFEHGKFSYDPCLRVPLIIRVPGGEPAVLRRSVALLDVFPTILDYAGLLPEDSMDYEGLSLIDHQTSNEYNGNRRVFAQSGGPRNPVWAVRDGRWKLIYAPSSKFRNLMTGSLYELYDLQADPGETNNLYVPDDSLFVSLQRNLHHWIDTKNNIETSVERVFDASDESTNENLRALGYIE